MRNLQAEVDAICSQSIDIGLSLADLARMVKRTYILEALALAGGNQSLAARAMGMHRNTLARDMHQLGIPGTPPGRRWAKREEQRQKESVA